jgi:hypothetical protein
MRKKKIYIKELDSEIRRVYFLLFLAEYFSVNTCCLHVLMSGTRSVMEKMSMTTQLKGSNYWKELNPLVIEVIPRVRTLILML